MSKRKVTKRPDRKSFLDDKIEYSGVQHGVTEIYSLKYNSLEFEEVKITEDINFNALSSEEYRNWFIVSGLSDNSRISPLISQLDLHKVDVKGILEVDDHSSISEYEDKIVFKTNSFKLTDCGESLEEQVSIVLCKNYIISFLEGGTESLDEVREALKYSKAGLRTRGCDYLFVILLDRLVSHHREVIDLIESKLDLYTERVVGADEPESLMSDMLIERRAYIRLKHIVYSLKECVTKLLRNSNCIISPEIIVYIEDLQQQLNFIGQDIESCDQTFNSIVNLHFNNNNQKMNDIMKRLTVISTIFLPVTFFVGLWGMNFKNMPETRWEYGYLIAWAIIFITALLSWYYLKRKKWL